MTSYRPCVHTRYLPSGLMHTPMGSCDCERDPVAERREWREYIRSWHDRLVRERSRWR